ncbi:sulfatase family protein [Echinicola shivajiensis]|uniref:sulfatase family protein n=1 Tax=Echinicola shivajiensis TaxID=1035916 RepID=UPI001BFC762C|nr:sulfatase [Echinicola shivajiensis]
MRIQNGFLGIMLLISFMFACEKTEESADKRPPNIIFIMSDDHAYQAISAYGHNLNETPNIDRIANEGAIFNRAYVTNSICAPSRAVILTGKHSFVNGKVDNVQPFDWDQDNFAKLLQSSGYQTALIGKIHLDGLPQGFDYSMVLPGQGHYYNPDFIVNGERKRFDGYVTDITTDSALDWLKNGRDQEKPFLLMYHQKAPHRNWKPAPEYLTLFDDKTFTPPSTYNDDKSGYAGRGRAAKEQEMEIDGHARWGHDFKMVVSPDGDSTGFDRELARFSPEQLEAWENAYGPKNDAFKKAYRQGEKQGLNEKEAEEVGIWKFNRYIKDYLRTIQSVDDGVGELLDYLEAEGLDENTIVVYTSDQGFYLGEHGWFDKRFMYEQSFRTPLLVKYPKEIKAGTKVDRLVQNLDFAPTFLDYAGLEIPKEMQGESFRGLVQGNEGNWRDAIYYTYYEYPSVHMVKRHYGVATERYKLMHFYYDIDEWELYDLEKDPQELNNLYNDPSYSDVQEMMHEKLADLRVQYGDSDANDERFLKEYLEVVNNRR